MNMKEYLSRMNITFLNGLASIIGLDYTFTRDKTKLDESHRKCLEMMSRTSNALDETLEALRKNAHHVE